MRLGQLLAELARRDVVLAADNDRLEVDAPKGVITPRLREQLVTHKAALLSAIRARRQESPCFACGHTEYWERPPEHGGGLVCCTCHPDPKTLGPASREELSGASIAALAGGNRQELARWALGSGCPELRFRPSLSVVGTPCGWLAFLQTASDADIRAALLATRAEGMA